MFCNSLNNDFILVFIITEHGYDSFRVNRWEWCDICDAIYASTRVF